MKGDKNPKDFIVFDANDFSVRWTTKDNTGEKKYITKEKLDNYLKYIESKRKERNNE